MKSLFDLSGALISLAKDGDQHNACGKVLSSSLLEIIIST